MMDRSEKTGLGLAIAGHIVLFGLLSVGFLATPNPLKLKNDPMDVTLATEADLQSQAPQSVEVPSSSQAPELGAPEESAPPPPAEVTPAPQPSAAPPAPAQPPKPVPLPKPAPTPKPQPREVAKPTPEKPAEKPAKAAPQQPARKPARPTAAAKPQPKAGSGLGSIMASIKPRERGSRLGSDFLKDISSTPTKSTAQTPRAAKVSALARASVYGLIKRQVQPCYDLGPLAGTSAMDIITVLRLQIRPDGSVSAATLSEQQGVNGDNRSYAQQMVDLSRRAILRCSPLKGLPADLYQPVWSDFDMVFNPRQLG